MRRGGLGSRHAFWPIAVLTAWLIASPPVVGRDFRPANPTVVGRDFSPANRDLPSRLSDAEYWQLLETFSEPDGFFQSDNLVGNERPLQEAVPALKAMKRGGVYLGVAPDQNFTYIVALEPKIAFIVDIRRGNLLEHLMYKAIIETSPTRADFVSRLFSRRRPAGLDESTSPTALFQAYATVEPSETVYASNLKAIVDQLTRTHAFALSPDDLTQIGIVYRMFFKFGPALTYGSSTSMNLRNMPTYAELQVATDREGRQHSYLATEAHYRQLKLFQERNLLVPIVGDFAGPKALRAVGDYLSSRGAVVSAFYTSNVEQYLFRNGVADAFYANVAALPIDDASVFVRSASGRNGVEPIAPFLRDVAAGRLRDYADVISRTIGRQP